MRKFVILFGILVITILSLSSKVSYAEANTNTQVDNEKKYNEYEVTLRRDIFCLMAAYPNCIKDVKREKNGNVYLITKSNTKILYDDKKNKSINEKMNNPDIQDMMEQNYPLSPANKLMPLNYDPGRIRIYSLLNEVYGKSKNKIESNLVNVNIKHRDYRFNSSNKAAQSLKKAIGELTDFVSKTHDLSVNVFPCNGTYNYRVIAGTDRLSAHSYGISIDLATNSNDYWQWASRSQGEKRLASYPKEIVEIFEKNNFIWGGKWGHFDIMHFEYRPEIIFKSRYFNDKNNSTIPWYNGVDTKDATLTQYINIIDKALK